jgi:hypothetical protein
MCSKLCSSGSMQTPRPSQCRIAQKGVLRSEYPSVIPPAILPLRDVVCLVRCRAFGMRRRELIAALGRAGTITSVS